eukprot:GFUD01103015.1.p1 GENE.GFUD01103015.1~~GFUD01103015.1.p1  ORF type:complete len:111 (+),score=12.73 GFUD01103015.1:49-381(+)
MIGALFLVIVCGVSVSGVPVVKVDRCLGTSFCNQINRSPFTGFGGFPGRGYGGAARNCVGSQCNQNNFERKKREAQIQNNLGAGFAVFPSGGFHDSGYGAVHNCVGSYCE